MRAHTAIAWALALAVAVPCTVGCGRGPEAAPPARPRVELHVSPACDLVPAAGARWVLEAKPRAISELADLIPAIALVVSEARFAAFASSHGGVDIRQVPDLCMASYDTSTLTVASVRFDAGRVESAFSERTTHGGTRSVDVPDPPVVALEGEIQGAPERLVLFGNVALALEHGKQNRSRAAEGFARGRLHRAAPALKTAPLAHVAKLAGDAPLRWFAAGPFESDAARGLGGLLRVTTAAAVTARFEPAPARIVVRAILTGEWGEHPEAAAERLAAAVHVLSESPLGRLLRLHQPVSAPRVTVTQERALVVDVAFDGLEIAKGIHDALDAEIAEIMQAPNGPARAPNFTPKAP